MNVPYPKEKERKRLNALKAYFSLDSQEIPDFNNITSLAAKICATPIAFVSLVYKKDNLLLSCYGTDLDKSSRNISFCEHAVHKNSDLYLVSDTHKSEIFKNNPIVKQYDIQFYAGAPLVDPDGNTLGTLCVYDHKPRTLTDVQKETLTSLAEQVMNLLELRKKNRQFQQAEKELLERNQQLENFAHVVSHDLKSPLANIISLTRFLREENQEKFNDNSLQYLDYIEESSNTLKELIDRTLGYYKTNELLNEQKTDVPLRAFFEKIKELFIVKDGIFEYPTTGVAQNINEPALTRIMLNLIDNALKYNTAEIPKITAAYQSDEDYHTFKITDNGIGIAKDIQQDIFGLFKTTGVKDREGKHGTGIGLATVKNLVEKMGGRIRVESNLGKGSTFIFTLRK
ncbi:GAF domain-containing sensor histidine kinase [Marixanthomonas spongiae]|uniref:histidine kinase n=1 Tax=Marixanthomonas spongiae TaxID=2174845 RepID=A0A2U0I3J4_9FLAO|nr:GAF domain-containing sensor histidine kinase [Marixanthomonas spongiae]PVW15634.1 hypothetical protein DDV96_05020 [Marixanthomonas spongiae]